MISSTSSVPRTLCTTEGENVRTNTRFDIMLMDCQKKVDEREYDLEEDSDAIWL